jgi:hypothetical protein
MIEIGSPRESCRCTNVVTLVAGCPWHINVASYPEMLEGCSSACKEVALWSITTLACCLADRLTHLGGALMIGEQVIKNFAHACSINPDFLGALSA